MCTGSSAQPPCSTVSAFPAWHRFRISRQPPLNLLSIRKCDETGEKGSAPDKMRWRFLLRSRGARSRPIGLEADFKVRMSPARSIQEVAADAAVSKFGGHPNGVTGRDRTVG